MKKILLLFMGVVFCAFSYGQRITGLSEATEAADEALMMIREGSSGNVLKKITIANLFQDLATLASPTFTGTVVIPSPFTLGSTSVTVTGDQLNSLLDTIVGSTLYPTLLDTIPKFVFGYGVGLATDTVACAANSDIGSWFNGQSDTIYVTKFTGVVKAGEGTPTVGVQFYYDANLWDGTPTAIIAETNIVSTTSGTEITSFTNQKIPPGVWVWGEIETVSAGNKPTALRITMLTYTSPTY